MRHPHRPAFRTIQAWGFKNPEQLFGLLAQLGIAAATQQPAGGDGFVVLPLAHPGGDHQEPKARPLRAIERVLLRQGEKQLQALAVVPALQGCLRFREVQCCVLLAHPLAASHHHGADASVGEDFEQEGMGNPAINDVGG